MPTGYYGPAGYKPPFAPGRPRDPARYSQDESRHRRCQDRFAELHYTGTNFVLSTELRACAAPHAEAISALAEPARLRRRVAEYVEDIHAGLSRLVAVVAKAQAGPRTAHLAGSERIAAMNLVSDLAQRPALFDPDAGELVTGTWVDRLADMARPLNIAVSDWLRNGYPPDAFELRGQLSRSEELVALLREAVDRPGVRLAELIVAAGSIFDAARQGAESARTRSDADKRAELAALGVRLGADA